MLAADESDTFAFAVSADGKAIGSIGTVFIQRHYEPLGLADYIDLAVCTNTYFDFL